VQPVQQPSEVRSVAVHGAAGCADLLATGHYARNQFDERSGRWILKRPADRGKDQTYFLFGLTQEQLSRTLFPLGEMRKPEVREEAKRAGLRLFEKPDSQEICFIPGGDYKQFLDAYLEEQGEQVPDTAGELVTSTGEVVERTTVFTTSPLASARGWEWQPDRRCTCWRFAAINGKSWWAAAMSCTRARCAPSA